jgi:alpha-tubulin suppressor-like RCC1 family protein
MVRSRGDALAVRLGAVVVQAPRGAIRKGQTLVIEKGVEGRFSKLGLTSVVGGPYTISTSQGEPRKPVRVTFDYNPGELSSEGKPLVLHGLGSGGDWVPEESDANRFTRTVTAKLDGFSPLDVVDYVAWLGGSLTGNRTDRPGNCGSIPDWINGASFPYERNDALPSCISRYTDAGTLRINIVNNRGYAQLVKVDGAQIDPDKSDPWSDSLDGMISKQLARLSPANGDSAFVLSPGASATIAIARPLGLLGEKAVSIQAAPRGGSAVAQMGWAFLNELKRLKKFTVPIKVSNCVIGVIHDGVSSGAGQASAINSLHSCVSAASGIGEAAKALMKKVAAAIFVTDIFNKVVDLTVDEAFPARIAFSFKGKPETSRDIRLDHLDAGTVPAGQVTNWSIVATGGTPPYSFAVSTIASNAGRVPTWVSLSRNGTLSIDPPLGTTGHFSFYVFATDSIGQRSATGLWEVSFTVAPEEVEVTPSDDGVISGGDEHTCALRPDRTVSCWGNNVSGQAQPPGAHFTAISAGESHTCGLLEDRALSCWGRDQFGQADPPGGEFVAVSAGGGSGSGGHTCALRSDGTALCWGDDSKGQADAPEGIFTAISAGGRHTCALRVEGTVVCWGDDLRGQTDAPEGTFTAISTGTEHTCAIAEDGDVQCWGDDFYNEASPPPGRFISISAGGNHSCGIQLSDRLARCWGVIVPASTAPSGKFLALSAGREHTCGVRTDGTVACEGREELGQATPPDRRFEDVSQGWERTCGIAFSADLECWGGRGDAVAPSGSFSSVSVGAHEYDFSCGVRSDRTLACWGEDIFFGSTSPPAGTFRAVSTGGSPWTTPFACAIRTDATLACWGDDSEGQSSPPSGFYTQVSSGDNQACAIATDETVRCWGDDFGLPTPPPAGHFKAIAAGAQFTCGIKADGSLVCWGDVPLSPPSGTFVAISAGSRHACAIAMNATVYCWGDDSEGESTPPPGAFSEIDAGVDSTCGLRPGGDLLCWGLQARQPL